LARLTESRAGFKAVPVENQWRQEKDQVVPGDCEVVGRWKSFDIRDVAVQQPASESVGVESIPGAGLPKGQQISCEVEDADVGGVDVVDIRWHRIGTGDLRAEPIHQEAAIRAFCFVLSGAHILPDVRDPAVRNTEALDHSVTIPPMAVPLPTTLVPRWSTAKKRTAKLRRQPSDKLRLPFDAVGIQ
jgi:hypothetical protein